MPEGSELYGVNRVVSIVWTRVGCTTSAADAGDADQRSAPNAASTAAHTKRREPANDSCRSRLRRPAPSSPLPVMLPSIRLLHPARPRYVPKNGARPARSTGKRGGARASSRSALWCAPPPGEPSGEPGRQPRPPGGVDRRKEGERPPPASRSRRNDRQYSAIGSKRRASRARKPRRSDGSDGRGEQSDRPELTRRE